MKLIKCSQKRVPAGGTGAGVPVLETAGSYWLVERVGVVTSSP